ncbi:MAG: hypothetical protein CML68_18890 [Rhodobacteraceae bacterium]|nr:hypothetical protein [Paracoccaceae bacterium]
MHDGKGCPLQAGTIVEVVCEDGFGFTMRQVAQVDGGRYSSWDWSHYPELKRILRYRVRKPKGLSLLEDRLAEIRTPAQGTPKTTTPKTPVKA